MTDRKPPSTKLEIGPGEDIWDAMARELSRNPDSPASLRIQSAINRAVAPRTRAVEQLVDALEQQLLADGEPQRAAVQAAIAHWEQECGAEMEPSILEDLRVQAAERIEKRRRQPPPMHSILQDVPVATDTGYALGVHLEGLQGTWHRLWAIACLSYTFGDSPQTDAGVTTVRTQFERRLGRPITPAEWDALLEHAKNHSQTVMRRP